MAYFERWGESAPTQFFYCLRSEGGAEGGAAPERSAAEFFLKVVPPGRTTHLPSYYIMSKRQLVKVDRCTGEHTDSVPLAEWAAHKRAYLHLRGLTFFGSFSLAKCFQRWRGNYRTRLLRRRRRQLQAALFPARPAFQAALLEAAVLLEGLRAVRAACVQPRRLYSAADWAEQQVNWRSRKAQPEVEAAVAGLARAAEGVCARVEAEAERMLAGVKAQELGDRIGVGAAGCPPPPAGCWLDGREPQQLPLGPTPCAQPQPRRRCCAAGSPCAIQPCTPCLPPSPFAGGPVRRHQRRQGPLHAADPGGEAGQGGGVPQRAGTPRPAAPLPADAGPAPGRRAGGNGGGQRGGCRGRAARRGPGAAAGGGGRGGTGLRPGYQRRRRAGRLSGTSRGSSRQRGGPRHACLLVQPRCGGGRRHRLQSKPGRVGGGAGRRGAGLQPAPGWRRAAAAPPARV